MQKIISVAMLLLGASLAVGCMHHRATGGLEDRDAVEVANATHDLDQDGIPDSKDQCQDSKNGQFIGPNGCPIRTHYGLMHNWVNFDLGKYALREDAKAILFEHAEILKKSRVKFELLGHADACGNADDNMRLSELRANAVKEHLISLQVAPESIARSYGKGSEQLLEANAVGVDCSSETNRRVEVLLLEPFPRDE